MTPLSRRQFVAALTVGLPLVPAAAQASGPRPGTPAPDIAGGPWINSGPLTMAGLRGRVVAVEFWTYG
jgi:hypothetical protein